jgi:hypothetical protein
MILDMISSEKSEGLFDRWTQHNNSCYADRENNKKNKKVSPIELFLLVPLDIWEEDGRLMTCVM